MVWKKHTLGLPVMAALAVPLGMSAQAQEPDASAKESPFSLALNYKADWVGVLSGGKTRRGYVLDQLDLTLDADLDRWLGLNGMTFHLDIQNTSGGAPNDNAGTLQGIDNIETSLGHTRLYEAWLEKRFESGLSLQAGLLDLNAQFYVTASAGQFILPAMGIGSELAGTGSAGPSIFPSTALAVRLLYEPDSKHYVRLAVFNAKAGAWGDKGGIDTTFNEGVLMIGEAGITDGYHLAAGLWRYSQEKENVRGPVFPKHTSQGAYLLFELPLNDPEGPRATTAFLKAGISDGETSPYRGGFQAGVAVEHVFAERPDSAFALGVNVAYLSSGKRALLRAGGTDAAASETQFEITYADTLMDHLGVQPYAQYVIAPGGDRAAKDIVVTGLRLNVSL